MPGWGGDSEGLPHLHRLAFFFKCPTINSAVWSLGNQSTTAGLRAGSLYFITCLPAFLLPKGFVSTLLLLINFTSEINIPPEPTIAESMVTRVPSTHGPGKQAAGILSVAAASQRHDQLLVQAALPNPFILLGSPGHTLPFQKLLAGLCGSHPPRGQSQ